MSALPAPFSYDALDAGLASTARDLAADLRTFHRRTTEDAFAFGQRLVALRDKIEDRTFVRWLESEVCVGKSTAYRFMSLAESFRGEEISQVGKLGPTVAYALAAKATPEKFRADVVRRIAAGEKLIPGTIEILAREAQRDEIERRRRAAMKAGRAKRQDPVRMAAIEKRAAREERKREADRLNAEAAMRAATEMIISTFDDERLSELLGLLETGREWTLRRAITAHLSERARQTAVGSSDVTIKRGQRERDFQPGGGEVVGRIVRHRVEIDGQDFGEIEEVLHVNERGRAGGWAPGINAVFRHPVSGVSTLGPFEDVDEAAKALVARHAEIRAESA